jgi:hypothetical protein
MTLVTGRVGCGKTGIIYDSLIEAAEKGRSALLLLPTRADVDRAVTELAGRSATGIRISRFDNDLDELWSLHGDGRALVGRMQRELLVRHAIETRGSLLGAERAPGITRLIASIAASEPALHSTPPSAASSRASSSRIPMPCSPGG